MLRTFSDWSEHNRAQQLSIDADQSEWEAIRYGSANIDYGIRDEEVAGEFDDWRAREDRAAGVADEIERRAAMLGEGYPFRKSRNGLEYRGTFTNVYEFCLAITFLESLSTRFGRRFQIAFERLVRDVLVCHLGRGAVGYRTGMPGDRLEPRPRRIKDILAFVADRSGPNEWRWDPLPDYPAQPVSGDIGTDVIAWRPFRHKRGCNLFFVGQCACGLEDWNAKFDEPNEGRLDSWIRPVGPVPFVRIFAVSFHIPNDAYLGDVARQARALPLDRARIVEIAERRGNKTRIRAAAKEPYSQLIRAAINAGRAVPRGRPRSRRTAAEERHSRSLGSAGAPNQP
jgi:hypothetical protein